MFTVLTADFCSLDFVAGLEMLQMFTLFELVSTHYTITLIMSVFVLICFNFLVSLSAQQVAIAFSLVSLSDVLDCAFC